MCGRVGERARKLSSQEKEGRGLQCDTERTGVHSLAERPEDPPPLSPWL